MRPKVGVAAFAPVLLARRAKAGATHRTAATATMSDRNEGARRVATAGDPSGKRGARPAADRNISLHRRNDCLGSIVDHPSALVEPFREVKRDSEPPNAPPSYRFSLKLARTFTATIGRDSGVFAMTRKFS